MKLKQYLEQLNRLVEKNPEALKMDVVYSRDDEGNDFQDVEFAPGLGNFERVGRGGDFTTVDELDGGEVNAVCIN